MCNYMRCDMAIHQETASALHCLDIGRLRSGFTYCNWCAYGLHCRLINKNFSSPITQSFHFTLFQVLTALQLLDLTIKVSISHRHDKRWCQSRGRLRCNATQGMTAAAVKGKHQTATNGSAQALSTSMPRAVRNTKTDPGCICTAVHTKIQHAIVQHLCVSLAAAS